jgi:uncharacterized protein
MSGRADEFSPQLLQSNVPLCHSALCRSCGLCCVSALYPRAGILQAEADLAHSLGLTVVEFNKDLFFYLPCPLYRQNRCSVYSSARPSVCVNFRCNLLKKFLAGRISFDQSLQVVKHAREYWTEVTMLLPRDYSFSDFRLLFEQATAKEDLNSLPDALRQNTVLLRKMFRLEWYFIEHFHLAKKMK